MAKISSDIRPIYRKTKMGTASILNKKTGLLSRTAVDLHPVSQRKTCLIRCMIASNCYTTLTSMFHTVYQPLWLPHPFLHQGIFELIDGRWSWSSSCNRVQMAFHSCYMGLKSGDIAGYSNR
ncbi:hypothetical protein TNCV_1666741 [Trichonephila clavipes]|nr:hypothetical protein TNCV_1666741 [Trichonephila clavipes]